MRADDLEIVPRVAFLASMAEFTVDQSGAQRGQCGEWFDRGAGREGLFKSEPRVDYGSQTSVLRIYDDDRALALAERFFGDLLQGGVEIGLGERGSRLRRLGGRLSLMCGAGGEKRNQESDLCQRTQHDASDALMPGWRIQLV